VEQGLHINSNSITLPLAAVCLITCAFAISLFVSSIIQSAIPMCTQALVLARLPSSQDTMVRRNSDHFHAGIDASQDIAIREVSSSESAQKSLGGRLSSCEGKRLDIVVA